MTIEFVTVDSEKIYEDLINQFEASLQESLYQGDERRIFLEQQGAVLVALYNSINDTGKQNLLRYARGEVLDAFGERTDTPRILALKAETTLRFTLSAAQPISVTIPLGTRGTPDGKLFFATTKALIIPSGALTADGEAQATEAGAAHNGLIAGQINQLVDPVPFVGSVTNVDTSSGGADIEPDDDGENIWSGYRGRIRDSVNKFSTAGPEDAYVFWAKTADSNISSVAVTTPNPGQVKITVLMQGGQLPAQDVLDSVLEICSAKKRRPVGDQVLAVAPTEVPYNIVFTYYISQEASAPQEEQIVAAVEGAGGAVEQYKTWQTALGRDINPDILRQLVLNAGAVRIDLTQPAAYTEIEKDEVAKAGTVTITYGGLL